MIEVVLHRAGRAVARVFDIEDPETAVLAAQTLWDDEHRAHPVQGTRLQTVFLVDGQVVRMLDGPRAA